MLAVARAVAICPRTGLAPFNQVELERILLSFTNLCHLHFDRRQHPGRHRRAPGQLVRRSSVPARAGSRRHVTRRDRQYRVDTPKSGSGRVVVIRRNPAPTDENPERWDCKCGGVKRILTGEQIRMKFAHLSAAAKARREGRRGRNPRRRQIIEEERRAFEARTATSWESSDARPQSGRGSRDRSSADGGSAGRSFPGRRFDSSLHQPGQLWGRPKRQRRDQLHRRVDRSMPGASLACCPSLESKHHEEDHEDHPGLRGSRSRARGCRGRSSSIRTGPRHDPHQVNGHLGRWRDVPGCGGTDPRWRRLGAAHVLLLYASRMGRLLRRSRRIGRNGSHHGQLTPVIER